MGPKKFRNYLDIDKHIEGNEERLESLRDILENGTFMPKPVGYKDIDITFKEWVENSVKMQDEKGGAFPIMSLYTTQRFSEYTQTWKYTDDNGNIILNFLTIKRESNPQFGTILGGAWNVPGNKYYFLAKKKVLDDNGSESYLVLRGRQPKPVDLKYTLSIFTTKFEYLNTFNTILNTKFSDRQEYIFPNGYAMPMVLENISDSSQYNINDRQFYSQSCEIKTLAYILNEDDFKLEEFPLKKKNGALNLPTKKRATVEIEDCESHNPYYHQPLVLTVVIPPCEKSVTFTIDCAFVADEVDLGKNVLNNYKVYVNGELRPVKDKLFKRVENGDEIKIVVGRRHYDEDAIIKFIGHNPDVIFDENKDNPQFQDEITQFGEEYTYYIDSNNNEEKQEK